MNDDGITFTDDFLEDLRTYEGNQEILQSDWFVQQHGYQGYVDGKFLPYKDSKGNWTIGSGIKLSDEEYNQFKGGITTEQEAGLFNTRLSEAHSQASKLFHNWDSFPQEVKEVATDLTYNMGYGTLKNEFGRFVDALNEPTPNYPKAMANLKFVNPSDLGDIKTYKDDIGDRVSEYYETQESRSIYNLDKLQRAYDNSKDTETDDGVFNVIRDQDEFV